jgi:hypothetical protein
MATFSPYSNNGEEIVFSGPRSRYFTPQPGTVKVDSTCPTLQVMDVGNWEDVLNYLGINPEV